MAKISRSPDLNAFPPRIARRKSPGERILRFLGRPWENPEGGRDTVVSDAETPASFGAPPAEDRSAAPGPHPQPKPMCPLATQSVGLERALHPSSPRCPTISNSLLSPGNYSGVNSSAGPGWPHRCSKQANQAESRSERHKVRGRLAIGNAPPASPSISALGQKGSCPGKTVVTRCRRRL